MKKAKAKKATVRKVKKADLKKIKGGAKPRNFYETR